MWLENGCTGLIPDHESNDTDPFDPQLQCFLFRLHLHVHIHLFVLFEYLSEVKHLCLYIDTYICIYVCVYMVVWNYSKLEFFLSSKSFRSFKNVYFFLVRITLRTAKQQPQDEISNVKVPQVHLELTNN